MKKYSIYIFVIVILLCNACKRENESQVDNVIPIKIDGNFYVDKFSNLFSDVQYVALEETRNSIVGTVSRLEITKGGDLVVFDARAGAVFRFASDGKFLNNIGFRGSGDMEYISPRDMKYDPFSDKVLVWDSAKRTILTYDLDGKAVSKIQLPWVIFTFGIIDEEHLICYMNNGEDIRGREMGTNYKIIRRDGLIEKEFGKYGIEKAGFYPPSENTFCFQLDRCLCFPPYSSTLFAIDGDSLNAIATFDLFDHTIPQEWLHGRYDEFYENLQKYPDLIEINAVYETDQYYLLSLAKDRVTLLCMVRKDDGRIKSISRIIINDLYGFVGNTNLIQAYDNRLYFPIESIEFEGQVKFLQSFSEGADLKKIMLKRMTPSALAQYFGEDGASAYIDSIKSTTFNLQIGEREMMDKMSKNSNPIIQICTLK